MSLHDSHQNVVVCVVLFDEKRKKKRRRVGHASDRRSRLEPATGVKIIRREKYMTR